MRRVRILSSAAGSRKHTNTPHTSSMVSSTDASVYEAANPNPNLSMNARKMAPFFLGF